MNSLVKLVLRFFKTTFLFALSYMFCFIVLTILIVIFQNQFVFMQFISIRDYLNVLVLAQSLFFIIAYGWYIGKPLVYLIRWIGRLSRGNYTIPRNHYRKSKDESSQSHDYCRPYNLYKEVFEQLTLLSTQLSSSEKERLDMEVKKQEWIAAISHDLKTPLSYIEGYAYMLCTREYNWTDEEKRSFSQQILDKALDLKSLIQDLNHSSQWSNINFPISLRQDNLIDFLRDIVIDIANHPLAEQAKFTYSTDMTSISVEFDRRLLGRAFQNILINAVIHNETGIHVTCDIRSEEDVIIITIEDDGEGIRKEQIEGSLYNSGKGLAIARAFIEAHQGEMNIFSITPKGTRLEVLLPKHKQ
ncbi:sensor histidine kinase [Paenibacillus fonticola]|uniref:sensor histidine kinase n=1 Tax=Paenibacillus fonticola TaxID=379896 RepID=UPI0003646A73|nr:HAMP domain-containing sensor histidine kinase [Paenibacillus fonticola]